MNPNPEFSNKTIVITGGGGVLCSHMAHTLAAQGARVAVLDISEANAAVVADEINNSGGTALAVEADVLSRESLEKAREKVNQKLGPCDILINGAGGNHPKGTTGTEFFEKADKELTTFFDLDPAGIQFVFNLNFIGSLLPTQVFARDMTDRSDCSVIMISSMNAFRPLTKIPAYSAAKAAISNFTQWLAVHFAKTGLRVNALAPGFFLTNQNRTLLLNESGELTPRGKTIIQHTPMERFGNPEDLDGALLWLCSRSSAFVTGVVIPVDGGFNAYSGV